MMCIPPTVVQALDDEELPPSCRVVIWRLRLVLDCVSYRELKVLALARMVRTNERTAGWALRELVRRGYLEEHEMRRPRAYRMPMSRVTGTERAA
jgi:hypothetical protein